MAETKRVIYYDQLSGNQPTNGDVIFVDNPNTGTHKMDLKSFVDAINNGFDSSIKSSGVSVSADNYSSIITNVNDQPVNSVYTYGAGLQSKVSNLPSNKAMTIINFAQKSTGGLGQVMLAVERNGSDDYLYFRTIGGSPAVWSSWVKVANNSDVEALREALDNLDIDTDKTLSIDGKPADAKTAGDAINDLKADLIDKSTADGITYSGNDSYADEWNNKDITIGGYIPSLSGVTFTHNKGEYGIATNSNYSGSNPYMAFNETDFIPFNSKRKIFFDCTYSGNGAIFDFIYGLYDSDKNLIGSSIVINPQSTRKIEIKTSDVNVAYLRFIQLRNNASYAVYPSSVLLNNFVCVDTNYVSLKDEIDKKENKIKYTTPLFMQGRWKMQTEGSGVYLSPNRNSFTQWCRTSEILHIISGNITVPIGYYVMINAYSYKADDIEAITTTNYSEGSTILFSDGWYSISIRHSDYSTVTPKDVINDINFNIVTKDYESDKLKAYFIGYKGLYTAPGDCTVFVTPNGKIIMVDSLKSECSEQLKKTLWTIGISNVDVVIVSHYHIDHIGGIISFLQNGVITFNDCTFYMANQEAADWAVENLAESFGSESISSYDTLKSLLNSHSEITQVYPNVEWQSITLDDVTISFFNTDHMQYTQSGVTSNYNDFSLGNYVNYGLNRICLPGDAGIGAMTKLAGKMFTTNIYKAQHHGLDNFRYRYYASIIDYWLTLNPDIIISEDGTYHDDKIDNDAFYPLQHWCEINCIPNYRTNVNGVIQIDVTKEQFEIMTVAKRSLRSTSLPTADKEENIV